MESRVSWGVHAPVRVTHFFVAQRAPGEIRLRQYSGTCADHREGGAGADKDITSSELGVRKSG